MKNILLLPLITLSLLSSLQVNAQLEKGTQYWGATVSANGGFNKSKGDQVTQNIQNQNVSLKLQWGVFTKSNFMIGLGAGTKFMPYTAKTKASGGEYETRSREFAYSIQPFVRWYKPLTEKIALYIEPALSIGQIHSHNKFEPGPGSAKMETKAKSFQTGVAVAPGISYRLGNRFALEADLNILHLGFTYTSRKGSRDYNFSSSASGNITSYLGLRGAFYLN